MFVNINCKIAQLCYNEHTMEKKKGIVIDIDKKLHMRLKLLAIAKEVPIYRVVEEFMRSGLEHEREILEKKTQNRK